MSNMADPKIEAIRALIGRHKRWDQVFAIVGLLAMMVGVVTLIALFIDLLIDGSSRLTWQFFTSFPSRHPLEAGILSSWVGTILVMLVTALAGVPSRYRRRHLPRGVRPAQLDDRPDRDQRHQPGRGTVHHLRPAGARSVRVPVRPRRSILAAGLTLGLLILPVVIVATREAIRAIPASMREAAYALGATKWQTVRHHVLPYSTAGIMTGVIIGMARAIGETAPIITIGALTFIAFLPPSPVTSEPPFISFDWLFAPFTVLPIQMFSWVSRPQVAFLDNAAAAGVVVIVATLAMNAAAIVIRYRFRKNIKW